MSKGVKIVVTWEEIARKSDERYPEDGFFSQVQVRRIIAREAWRHVE